jgi:hypothetical protein
MKKILIIIIFCSDLLFTKTPAWTGERVFFDDLRGYTLSEQGFLLLLGTTLFSLSLFWKKVKRKAIGSSSFSP